MRAQFEAWSKAGGVWNTFSAAQPIEVLEAQLLEHATGLVESSKVCVCVCVWYDDAMCGNRGHRWRRCGEAVVRLMWQFAHLFALDLLDVLVVRSVSIAVYRG